MVFQLVFLAGDVTGSDVPSITFNFSKRPLSPGSYKIVGFPRADNELSIFCNGGSGAFYNSTGNDGATVQLSFTNGKLSHYRDKTVVEQNLFVGGTARACLLTSLSVERRQRAENPTSTLPAG